MRAAMLNQQAHLVLHRHLPVECLPVRVAGVIEGRHPLGDHLHSTGA